VGEAFLEGPAWANKTSRKGESLTPDMGSAQSSNEPDHEQDKEPDWKGQYEKRTRRLAEGIVARLVEMRPDNEEWCNDYIVHLCEKANKNIAKNTFQPKELDSCFREDFDRTALLSRYFEKDGAGWLYERWIKSADDANYLSTDVPPTSEIVLQHELHGLLDRDGDLAITGIVDHIVACRSQLNVQEQDVRRLKSEIDAQRAENRQLKSEIDAQRAENCALKQHYDKMLQGLDAACQDLETHAAISDALVGQRNALEDQVKTLELANTTLKAEMAEKQANANQERVSMDKKLSKLLKKCERIQSQVQEAGAFAQVPGQVHEVTREELSRVVASLMAAKPSLVPSAKPTHSSASSKR
jgi:cob(I)alamin adenosyltransferase